MNLKQLLAPAFITVLLGLPLGGCESTTVEDFCNKKCLCETCTATQQTQCTTDGDADRALYEGSGCDYDEFLFCAVDTTVCADTGVSYATTCDEQLLASCDTPPAQ